MLLVGKALLSNERELVQPVNELLAVGADDLRLRVVDVGVDEPGEDDRICAVLVDGRPWRKLASHFARRPEMRDLAVRHANNRVGLVAHGALEPLKERVARIGQHAPADGGYLAVIFLASHTYLFADKC